MADVIRGISSSTLINCLNASSPHQVILPNLSSVRKVVRVPDSKVAGDFGASLLVRSRKELCSLKVHAAFVQAYNQQKWWERNAPNMIDIHSEEEFSSALSEAGDRLVIVEFYGTWCGSCRALFPRLCRTAEEHPEILFLKVNFDENKEMSKSMDVKVLPYFQFYRGADNRLDAFSCSLVQFQKIRGAIALHNPKPCSNGSILVNGDHKLDQATLVKEEPAESAAS